MWAAPTSQPVLQQGSLRRWARLICQTATSRGNCRYKQTLQTSRHIQTGFAFMSTCICFIFTSTSYRPIHFTDKNTNLQQWHSPIFFVDPCWTPQHCSHKHTPPPHKPVRLKKPCLSLKLLSWADAVHHVTYTNRNKFWDRVLFKL